MLSVKKLFCVCLHDKERNRHRYASTTLWLSSSLFQQIAQRKRHAEIDCLEFVIVKRDKRCRAQDKKYLSEAVTYLGINIVGGYRE